MTLSRSDLERTAASTGFQVESLEKAFRLLDLLQSLRSHPFLKSRFVLKGGTALNLFMFDVPRLSVDLDLNYIGAEDRDTMLSEKPAIQQAVNAVCGRAGIRVMRVPGEHAGGKWRLSYDSVMGRTGTLEIDINYVLRRPLWPYRVSDSRPVGTITATQIPVLDLHELAAGKLAALFSRNAGRDLFDVCTLLRASNLERSRIRLGFVIYGGANRRDWREISLDDVRADPREVEQQLLPMLRADLAPARSDIGAWSERLVVEGHRLLAGLLPLTADEMEFLRLLNGVGEIRPEILTIDETMQSIIRAHPGLKWKVLNVRKSKGIVGHQGMLCSL
jgi:predicted nucleotidyltransferase component of viral defense system